MLTRRNPTTRELLAWFLWDKLDGGPPDSPDSILGWIDEYVNTSPLETQGELYASYQEFADQFLPPSDGFKSPDEDDEDIDER